MRTSYEPERTHCVGDYFRGIALCRRDRTSFRSCDRLCGPANFMTPNARSVALLELEGYAVDIVERRITRIVTRDYLGCVDLIGVREGQTLAVQSTTADHFAHRRKKLEASPMLPKMIAAGWRIEVHGWRKKGREWVVRREQL